MSLKSYNFELCYVLCYVLLLKWIDYNWKIIKEMKHQIKTNKILHSSAIKVINKSVNFFFFFNLVPIL